MKNKYTNKALKNNNAHFHSNNYTTGYVEVKKSINIFTLLKVIFIICVIAIVSFYLITL